MRRSAIALAVVISFTIVDWTKATSFPTKPQSSTAVWLVVSDGAVPSGSDLPQTTLKSFVATLDPTERASLAQMLAELRARAEAQANPFLEDFGDGPIEEDALGVFQRYGQPALLMATLAQESFRTREHRTFPARTCPFGAHCIDIRSPDRDPSDLHGLRLVAWPLRHAIIVRLSDRAVRDTFTEAARKGARTEGSCIGLVLALSEDSDPDLTIQLQETLKVSSTARAPSFLERDEVWLLPTKRCFLHGDRLTMEARAILPSDAQVNWPPL